MSVRGNFVTDSDSDRVDSFPDAAKVFDSETVKGKTILEEVKENRKAIEEEYSVYHPFQNSDDFSVAAWLSNSGASMETIDRFLKLPFVRLIAR